MKFKKRKVFLSFFLLGMMVAIAIVTNETKNAVKEEVKQSTVAVENVLTSDQGVLVLCYHRTLKKTWITENVSLLSNHLQVKEYNIWLEEFEKQMNFLKDHDIVILTMDQLIKKVETNSVEGKAVVVSFDAIDKSVVEGAYPIMNELSIPFTQFIITGKTNQIVEGCRLASWTDISRINDNSLVTTGLQTHDLHYQKEYKPALSTKISEETIKKDFDTSQQEMSKYTGELADYFAYPYGYYNHFLDTYMSRQGIQAMFTLTPGVVTNKTDIHKVPRFVVTENNWQNIERWLLE